MSLWWLQPGWTEARCSCGAQIWPEGDPDWGACYSCFSQILDQQQHDANAQAEYEAEMQREYEASYSAHSPEVSHD